MDFKSKRYASSYDHVETRVLYFVKNDVKTPLHTLKSYASQNIKANVLVFFKHPCLLSNIFKYVLICIIKPYICVKINFHSSCIKYTYIGQGMFGRKHEGIFGLHWRSSCINRFLGRWSILYLWCKNKDNGIIFSYRITQRNFIFLDLSILNILDLKMYAYDRLGNSMQY